MRARRVVAPIIIAVAVGLVPIATAAASPYTEKEMVHASLRASDVPKSYFVNQTPSRDLAYTGSPNAKHFEMCVDKDGNKVWGDAPVAHENATVVMEQVGEGADTQKLLAITSDIYTYKGKDAAQQAWKNLKKATKQCAPSAGTQVPVGDKEMVDVIATQTITTLKKHNGQEGFSNEQHVAVAVAPGDPAGISLWVGGYTAYRVVGKAIVRAAWANYTRASLEDAALMKSWLKFTREEANTIADRLA